MLNNPKRKVIENKILKIIGMLDPDPNGNIKQYKDFFKSMNNSQFEKWLKKIKTKEAKLFFFVPNFVKNITINELLKIAEASNTKLFHKLRYMDDDHREIVTNVEHLVLKLPVRRVIQSLKNKIGFPQDDKKISQITGAPIQPSKGSKLDSIQINLLMSKNLDNAVKELVNVRGGNIEAYYEYKNLLMNKGEVSLSELSSSSRPRAIDTTSSVLKAMGFDTNI